MIKYIIYNALKKQWFNMKDLPVDVESSEWKVCLSPFSVNMTNIITAAITEHIVQATTNLSLTFAMIHLS